MTAHECEEYIEEPPQRKRYALRKPERQRDFLRLKLTLPSERRTGKPPPDPLLVLCRLQIHRGSRCSTVTKIPDTTILTLSSAFTRAGSSVVRRRLWVWTVLFNHESNRIASSGIWGSSASSAGRSGRRKNTTTAAAGKDGCLIFVAIVELFSAIFAEIVQFIK